MVTFRNNNRRHRFRSNDRFKKNNDLNKIKFKSESNASGFQRKIQIGRNGQNLPKIRKMQQSLTRLQMKIKFYQKTTINMQNILLES